MKKSTLLLAALPLAFAVSAIAQTPDVSAELSALEADARFVAARAVIAEQHDARVRDLITLTEIPAPPFAEAVRAEAFADMMRATGFGEVAIDDAGNVVARRQGVGGERTVTMVAHLDTVFPEGTDVTVTVEGNRYAAPGIGDNTRGAVMLLELASAIAGAEIATQANILLVGNVGEEGLGDLRGVRHLFRDGTDHPDALIAIDGGEQARLITGAIGSNRYRVTYRGAGGHSWGDFGAGNPHHAAARAIALFDERGWPVTQAGDRSSYNIGRMGGGTSVNSIPFESWFEVDMRSGDPERLASLDVVFRETMQAGLVAENGDLARGAPLTLEIEPIGERPAGQGDQDSPLVLRAIAVLEDDGIEPQISSSSTDANIPISLGVPAITISRCGSGGGAHSPDEYWIDDEDVVACTVRGLEILLLEAGLAGG